MANTDSRAYTIGPTLAPDEAPWPTMWEHDADIQARIHDGHAHEWECVLLAADGARRTTVEEVVRCAVCHAPRCGHSTDDNPCLEVRHHREMHHYALGGFEPVGGT